MRRAIAAILAVITLGLGQSVQAQNQPVVVELYTSQGCSSCPPADALLAEIASRNDVIALALHVDYWDYIGWKDEFADPAFTKRQRTYSRVAGKRSIYTPQMIIGGVDHVIGNRPMKLADAMNAHRSKPSNVDLKLSRDGGALLISMASIDGKRIPGKMVLQLVHIDPKQNVRITRGENAGKTITYANIVTNWQQIGVWDGRRGKQISVDLGSNNQQVAVILQAEGQGPIVAAAQLR